MATTDTTQQKTTHVTPHETPTAQSRHESSYDQRYRVNIRSRKKYQQALPNNLIEQSRETRSKKNHEGGPTVARRARLICAIIALTLRTKSPGSHFVPPIEIC